MVRVSRYGPGSATFTGRSVVRAARSRARGPPADGGGESGPKTAGWRTLPAGHVERPQLALELLRVVHVGQQVGDRDELAVVEPAADEARVVVAPLLAVGDDVDAGARAGPRSARRTASSAVASKSASGRRPSRCSWRASSIQRGRGQLPIAHDRERRDGGGGRRRGSDAGMRTGTSAAPGHAAAAAGARRGRGGAAAAARTSPCRRGSCAARPGRSETSSLPVMRHQAGRSSPTEVSRRADLQQLAGARAGRCAGGSAGAGRCRSRASPPSKLASGG